MNNHCSKYNPTSSSFKCTSTTLNISDLLSHHRDDNALQKKGKIIVNPKFDEQPEIYFFSKTTTARFFYELWTTSSPKDSYGFI